MYLPCGYDYDPLCPPCGVSVFVESPIIRCPDHKGVVFRKSERIMSSRGYPLVLVTCKECEEEIYKRENRKYDLCTKCYRKFYSRIKREKMSWKEMKMYEK